MVLNIVERTDAAIDFLKSQQIDSSIGHNDIAILFALTQGEINGSIADPVNYISAYLSQVPGNPDIPENSKLDSIQVKSILQEIHEVRLIRKTEWGYHMNREVMAIITWNIDRYMSEGLVRYALLGIIPYTIPRDSSVERRNIADWNQHVQ